MESFINKSVSDKFVSKQLFPTFFKQDIKEYWRSIEKTKSVIVDSDYLFNLIRSETQSGHSPSIFFIKVWLNLQKVC